MTLPLTYGGAASTALMRRAPKRSFSHRSSRAYAPGWGVGSDGTGTDASTVDDRYRDWIVAEALAAFAARKVSERTDKGR